MPQTADGVKPVCTVVYNDFPLTFTKAEVFVRSNAYTFRGEYTRQAGALAAVTLPEYSFDGENWIREGENNIFRADDGYYIAFPCDQWDVSANPYIYIRLRGETEEQVYYSNVLRYAANNMDIAEDLGGSRGGGTSIVNPPEEPEKPGESGKPEESERPGESGKPEESERPGESEKPEEPEKSCESQKSAEPRKLPKQENANEPDVPEKCRSLRKRTIVKHPRKLSGGRIQRTEAHRILRRRQSPIFCRKPKAGTWRQDSPEITG